MAHPRPRRDRYGKPLPTLAPAPRQDLLTSEQNTAMRRYLLWLLEHEYGALFCRGIWAEITVTLTITDGTLRDDLDIYVCRHHRHEAGG